MHYLMNRLHPAFNRLVAEAPATIADGETSMVVPTRPLNDILDELLPRTPVDLLNVDCEGYDLEVLKTLDFSSHKPRVIAAEDGTMDIDSMLGVFLRSQGYECKAFIGLTKIFQLVTD